MPPDPENTEEQPVSASTNGQATPPQRSGRGQSTPRAPRRLVLLTAGEASAVEAVLAEYQGADISGNRLHAALQQFADSHRGRQVAAEWLGPLGWTRFLWCRK
jgi:hypothetical protein